MHGLVKLQSFLSCLPYIYWVGFVSDFGLYRRQTSQQGPFWFRDLSRQNHLVSAHLVLFYRPVISYHFSGHLVPSFIMGFNLLMLFFYVSKLLFKPAIIQENDQMRIGKFYHISRNAVLFRLFNNVNPLCLYVCIYTNNNKFYYYTVEEF